MMAHAGGPVFIEPIINAGEDEIIAQICSKIGPGLQIPVSNRHAPNIRRRQDSRMVRLPQMAVADIIAKL